MRERDGGGGAKSALEKENETEREGASETRQDKTREDRRREEKRRDLNRIEGVSVIAITVTIITTSAHARVFFLLDVLALEVLAGLLLGLASVHLGAARGYLLRILPYVPVIQYFALACNILILAETNTGMGTYS